MWGIHYYCLILVSSLSFIFSSPTTTSFDYVFSQYPIASNLASILGASETNAMLRLSRLTEKFPTHFQGHLYFMKAVETGNLDLCQTLLNTASRKFIKEAIYRSKKRFLDSFNSSNATQLRAIARDVKQSDGKGFLQKWRKSIQKEYLKILILLTLSQPNNGKIFALIMDLLHDDETMMAYGRLVIFEAMLYYAIIIDQPDSVLILILEYSWKWNWNRDYMNDLVFLCLKWNSEKTLKVFLRPHPHHPHHHQIMDIGRNNFILLLKWCITWDKDILLSMILAHPDLPLPEVRNERPALIACIHGSLNCLELLLNDDRLEISDSQVTQLQMAAFHGRRYDVMEVLDQLLRTRNHNHQRNMLWSWIDSKVKAILPIVLYFGLETNNNININMNNNINNNN